MAIPRDYPSDKLPPPLVGKNREMMERFESRSKFDGRMLARKVRDSSTVYYNVSFKIPARMAMTFWLWLQGVADKQPFNMDIKTEGGFQPHSCRWFELPLGPQEGQNFFVYSGIIYAEALNTGTESLTDEQKEVIYCHYESRDQLAEAVNVDWPI